MLDYGKAESLGRVPYNQWDHYDRQDFADSMPEVIGELLVSAQQEPPVTENIIAVAATVQARLSQSSKRVNESIAQGDDSDRREAYQEANLLRQLEADTETLLT